MEEMVSVHLVNRFVSGPKAQGIHVHIYHGKKPRWEGEYLNLVVFGSLTVPATPCVCGHK